MQLYAIKGFSCRSPNVLASGMVFIFLDFTPMHCICGFCRFLSCSSAALFVALPKKSTVHPPPFHVGYFDEVDLRHGGHDARALEHAPDAQQGELAAGEQDGDPAGEERRAEEEDGPLPPVVAVTGRRLPSCIMVDKLYYSYLRSLGCLGCVSGNSYIHDQLPCFGIGRRSLRTLLGNGNCLINPWPQIRCKVTPRAAQYCSNSL